MKIQHKKIIQELYKANGWMTSNDLSSLIGVSVRSIKSYISEINFLYKNCIKSSRKGYRLKENTVLKAIEEENKIPLENDERVLFLTKRMLQDEEDKPILIDDLSDELYISNAVLFKVLKQARELCDQFNIEISLSNNLVSLIGKEEDKRKLMKHIYLIGFGTNKLSMNILQKLFVDYDVVVVRSILHETCKKYKYYINGYSFDYLILDTLITLNRIKNNHSGTKDFKEIIQHNTNEFALAQEIIYKFEKIFQVYFNSFEVASYTSILVSYLMKLDYKTITNEDLTQLVGKKCINLVDSILKVVSDYYFVQIKESDFYIKFVIHIYNLLYRTQTQLISNNPITGTIKRNNPLLFDCGVKIADVIHSATGCQINEDEIAYIAIHIGAALDSKENLSKKIQTILIFPQYYNFHLMLEERIHHDFEKDINIINVLTSAAELTEQPKKYNLIISAIPVNSIKNDYVVEINSFYTPKDCQKIRKMIDRIRKDQKRSVLLEQLVSISSPDLFIKNGFMHDKDSVLHYINNVMVEKGFSDNDYLDDVYKREEASSTNFGNIAVPHGISLNCQKTGLFIYISERGIQWDDSIDNIVIFISINQTDTEIFRNVYDNLIVLLLDNKVVTDVVKCKDYYDFIDIIIQSF